MCGTINRNNQSFYFSDRNCRFKNSNHFTFAKQILHTACRASYRERASDASLKNTPQKERIMKTGNVKDEEFKKTKFLSAKTSIIILIIMKIN